MRTVIDRQGCNTVHGSVGLTISEGDLIVNGTNVLEKLRELASAASRGQDSSELRTALEKTVNNTVSQLQEQHESTKSELSDAVDSLRKEFASVQKDLKDAKKENEKLAERVKTLETDLKKATKATSKTASSEA